MLKTHFSFFLLLLFSSSLISFSCISTLSSCILYCMTNITPTEGPPWLASIPHVDEGPTTLTITVPPASLRPRCEGLSVVTLSMVPLPARWARSLPALCHHLSAEARHAPSRRRMVARALTISCFNTTAASWKLLCVSVRWRKLSGRALSLSSCLESPFPIAGSGASPSTHGGENSP